MTLISFPTTTPAPGRTPPAPHLVRDNPYTNPFTVIVDTRESAPFTFLPTVFNAGSRHAYRPLIIPTVRRGLPTGDYSIEVQTPSGPRSQHDFVVVERKSLADLFGSLAGKGGERRERFEREHERMQAIVQFGGFAHVVIEASPDDVRNNPPDFGAAPEAVLSTSVKWARRYGVAWHWAGSRAEAERMTFRLLRDAFDVLVEQSRQSK